MITELGRCPQHPVEQGGGKGLDVTLPRSGDRPCGFYDTNTHQAPPVCQASAGRWGTQR